MAEKIRVKGRLRLPISGVDPSFAQLRFAKVELSEKDILPDSADIFTCDLEGNYDFEIYTGSHLFSHTSGKEWSEPIELIVEPLAEGLSHVRISDLIGFQSIPELDDVTSALNQQKQELLAIQQETELLRDEALSSSDQATESARLSSENLSTLMSSSLKRIKFNSGDYSEKLILLHKLGGLAGVEDMFFGYVSANRISGIYEPFDCRVSSQKKYYDTGESFSSVVVNSGAWSEIYPCYCVVEGVKYFAIRIGQVLSSLGSVFVHGEWNTEPSQFIYYLNGEVVDQAVKDSIIKIDNITSLNSLSARIDSIKNISHEGIVYKEITRNQSEYLGISSEFFESTLAVQHEKEFFESESKIAQRIFFDFTFGLGEYQIIPMEMEQVKEYIQSIDPSRVNVRGAVRNLPRPDIFSRYD